MIFGFQPLHLVIIFLVALVVFGPNRLPEIGRGLGKAMVEFRKGARELNESFQEEVNGAPRAAPAVQNSGAYPQPQSGNFCIQCGAPNPVGASFCNQCGSRLPAAETSLPAAPPVQPENSPEDIQDSQ